MCVHCACMQAPSTTVQTSPVRCKGHLYAEYLCTSGYFIASYVSGNCRLSGMERVSDRPDLSQPGTHARLLPSGARAPWERGFLFHRLTLRSFIHAAFTDLALPCERWQAEKNKHKRTCVGHSLDPEVIGSQFSVVDLQHDASVLQRPLPHLSKVGSTLMERHATCDDK